MNMWYLSGFYFLCSRSTCPFNISPGYFILINKVGEIVLYHVDIIPRTPLNALQQANRILMLGVFNNLDSNNLVLTYVPSHRPKSGRGLTLDLLYGEDSFNIHTLMPSQHNQTPNGITVQGIQTTDRFNMRQFPLPQVANSKHKNYKLFKFHCRLLSFLKLGQCRTRRRIEEILALSAQRMVIS